MQELLAARYVATLQDDEIYKLLQESSLVQDVVNSKAVCLSCSTLHQCLDFAENVVLTFES